MRSAKVSSRGEALQLWSVGLVLANLPFIALGVFTGSWVLCVTAGFTTLVCIAVASDIKKPLGFRVFFCVCFTMFWWVVSIAAVCLWSPASPPPGFTQGVQTPEKPRPTPVESGNQSEGELPDDESSLAPE